jgi:hypothetical protein
MKNVKNVVLSAILITTLGFAPGANAQKVANEKEGHGGKSDELEAAAIEVEFRNIGLMVYEDLITWNRDKPAEIDPALFLAKVRGATIKAVTQSLSRPHPKTRVLETVDAKNYGPNHQLIEVNIDAWKILKNRIIRKKALVAHEFFGLYGIELDTYEFSAPFKVFLENSGLVQSSDLLNSVPADGSFDLAHLPAGSKLIIQRAIYIYANTTELAIKGGTAMTYVEFSSKRFPTERRCMFGYPSSQKARYFAAGTILEIVSSTDESSVPLFRRGTRITFSGNPGLILFCVVVSHDLKLESVDTAFPLNSLDRFRRFVFGNLLEIEIAPPERF